MTHQYRHADVAPPISGLEVVIFACCSGVYAARKMGMRITLHITSIVITLKHLPVSHDADTRTVLKIGLY